MTNRFELEDDKAWSSVVQPPSRKLEVNLGDLWSYKYLIYLLIKRDFTTAYKQTILGPLWFLIQPLMTTGIYSIVFAGVAKIPTDSIPAPLFYLAGNTIWAFFSGILSGNQNVLAGNGGLFGKVYFPRLVVPLATCVSKLYQFGVQFVFLSVVLVFYMLSGAKVHPNLWLLAIPLSMLQLGLLGLGFGLWISAWTVKYRDLGNLVGFGMSLWMWATPIVYPMSFITSNVLKVFIWINPAASSVELFRLGFTGAGTFDPLWFLYSWAWSIGTFILGLALFNRAERTYVDTV